MAILSTTCGVCFVRIRLISGRYLRMAVIFLTMFPPILTVKRQSPALIIAKAQRGFQVSRRENKISRQAL
jgi:hypothetical protein